MKDFQDDKKCFYQQGWEEAFQEMAKIGNDELLIPDVFNDEDFKDWA